MSRGYKLLNQIAILIAGLLNLTISVNKLNAAA